MKSILIVFASAVAASTFTAPVLAAQTQTEKPESNSYGRSRAAERERLGKVSKANDIIGMEVKNLQDVKLGKVEDLGISLESGRIVQVIVASGGVWGIGDKTLAVPPSSFSWDTSPKVLRLDIDKERLKAAPTVDLSKWNECCETERVAEVYRFYHQENHLLRGSDGRMATPQVSRLSHVERASKLIGMSVRNRQEEKLGTVDNVMVDLNSGRVVQLIISSGGFLGMGDTLSVVPPAAFHYDHEQRVLHLDTTKDALAKAPHFTSKEWPNLSDPAYVSGVYRAYRVEPYFNPDADNTARNVRDRGETLTPFDQGSSDADLDTTRRIRKEILSQENLSVNARNIKVITVNGRVTLRGPVNSDEEKRLLTGIAGRVVEARNIEDQLEVKRDN